MTVPTGTASENIPIHLEILDVLEFIMLLYTPVQLYLQKHCAAIDERISYTEYPLHCWQHVILFESHCGKTSLRNFGNSVYPTFPVSFGGDTKSRRSLLSGVYARGSKISHQSLEKERGTTLKITLCIILKFEC